MKALRARDKADLYEQLAGLLEAGVPIARAVGMLGDRAGGGAVASALRRCGARMSDGETLSASKAADGGAWQAFESEVVAAGEEAGRMVPLLREMGRYWRMMDETRRRVLAGLVYPMLVLHVAVLAGNVPVAVAGGMGAYARVVAISLFVIYSAMWFVWEFAGSAVGMGLLRRLPVVGTAVSALGALRFALCLRLQVEAGIPILTALPRAALAAGGRALGTRAEGAVRRLRDGAPVGEVLAGLFGGELRLTSLLATGVESGRIVEMLRLIEGDASARWAEAMALLQVWVPRAVYFLAMAFAVWQISRLAAGIYGAYGEAAALE
jgi:type II secretory pathway component PulF